MTVLGHEAGALASPASNAMRSRTTAQTPQDQAKSYSKMHHRRNNNSAFGSGQQAGPRGTGRVFLGDFTALTPEDGHSPKGASYRWNAQRSPPPPPPTTTFVRATLKSQDLTEPTPTVALKGGGGCQENSKANDRLIRHGGLNSVNQVHRTGHVGISTAERRNTGLHNPCCTGAGPVPISGRGIGRGRTEVENMKHQNPPGIRQCAMQADVLSQDVVGQQPSIHP